MKKPLLIVCSIMLCLGAVAQRVPHLQHCPIPIDKRIERKVNQDVQSKSSTCIDLLSYPESKLNYFGNSEEVYLLDFWGIDDDAISQTFKWSGGSMFIDYIDVPIKLRDFNMSTFCTVTASIYSVNANNIPTTLINASTATIDILELEIITFYFSSPVEVTNDFAIVISPITSDGVIEMLITDPTPHQFFDENLTKLKSFWDQTGSFGQFITPEVYTSIFTNGPWSFDLVVRPHVSYDYEAFASIINPEACIGNEVLFQAVMTPQNGFSSRTTNFYSMVSYFDPSVPEASIIWNPDINDQIYYFGDLSINHAYYYAGLYDSRFILNGGFNEICVRQYYLPTITITNPANVQFPPLDAICINHEPIPLNGATPTGGIYHGSGVSNGTFDPSEIEVGTSYLFYEYKTPECTSVAFQSIEVMDCLSSALVSVHAYSIYPNPAISGIRLESNVSESSKLSIWTLDGKLITNEIAIHPGINFVSLETFSTGTYLFKISSNESQSTVRVVKQ